MLKAILQKIEYPGLEDLDFENLPEGMEEKVLSHINNELLFKKVAHENTDVVKKIVGKRVGEIETYTKQKLKALGESFDVEVFGENDLEGKKYEGMIDLGIERLTDGIQAMKDSAQQSDDTKLDELQKKYDGRSKDFKSLQSKFEALNSEKEELNNQFTKYKENQKYISIKDKELSGVKFSEKADQYWKNGFFSEFDSKFSMVLDDESELGYKMVKSGTEETILDGSKPKSYGKMVEELLKEKDMLQVNGNANGTGNKGEKYEYVSPKKEDESTSWQAELAKKNMEKIGEAKANPMH